MKFSEKLKIGGSKAVRTAMAGVLAVGLMPLPAFADDLSAAYNLTAQASAKPAEGYVIAAAYAAAEPAPELLGLNNPNFRNAGEVTNIAKIFGDDSINESVDPYVYNYVNGLTPGVILKGRGTPNGNGQTSPMAALNKASEDKAAAEVWKLKPHIVLGTGSDSFPNKSKTEVSDFYSKDPSYHGQGEGYNPIAVTYQRTTLPTMVATMYRLAEAAKASMGNDGSLKTRYEDPMSIAQDYERYSVGAKGAVKWAIDNGKVKKKTVALVNGYLADGNVYQIITDGAQEGTATTNRYLEAVQGVTANYYDSVPASSLHKYTVTGQNGATSEADCAWVSADDLKGNVDLLIVGSNAGNDSDVITKLLADGLLDKTFYCTDWSAGSVFGTTVNSVENAQNIGRILPCAYPEVLDQSDMIAYYYDTFYHIKDGAVGSTIDANMDGVRNWNNTDSASYTNWSATDVSDYKHDGVETLLKQGITYLKSQGGLSTYMTPTANLAADNVDPSGIKVKQQQEITASDITKTLGEPAFQIEAKTSGDGTLSFKSADEGVASVSSSGMATIKAVGSTEITISAPETDDYMGAEKTITLTVVKTPAKGAEVEGVTASKGSTVDVLVTAGKAVTITSSSVKKGASVNVNTVKINGKTYKVTAIGANAFKGTKAKEITIGKNVTKIGKGAFQGAKKLTKLTIGKNVATIGKNAVKGAKKLKGVTLSTSKLNKKSLTNLLKGSKIKTVTLKGVSDKAAADYAKWAKNLDVAFA